MPVNRGPITSGVDFNFFEKVVVTKARFGVEADGYAADVVILLKGNIQAFTLVNEGSEVVEYSFNGNTLHGDMTPNTPTGALSFDNRVVSKIWFRVANGSSVVRVEAWAR